MTALSSKYNKAWLYLLTWISERASLSGSRLSPGLISVDADGSGLCVSPPPQLFFFFFHFFFFGKGDSQ